MESNDRFGSEKRPFMKGRRFFFVTCLAGCAGLLVRFGNDSVRSQPNLIPAPNLAQKSPQGLGLEAHDFAGARHGGKPTATPTPNSAGTRPSLDLEGQGAITPGPEPCSQSCPGTFTSSLTGRPFRRLSLNLDLSVDSTAGPDLCYLTTGFGQFGGTDNLSNGFDARFQGKFCTSAGFAYDMSGTLTISPMQPCQVPQTVIVGTLLVSGAVHTSGPMPPPSTNPIPLGGNSDAVVSLIGTTGQIAAPCPSP